MDLDLPGVGGDSAARGGDLISEYRSWRKGLFFSSSFYVLPDVKIRLFTHLLLIFNRRPLFHINFTPLLVVLFTV